MKNKKKINIQSQGFEGNYKSYALISVSDITDLQKFEKTKLVEKFKTMYLQSLAHDLRTPLNTIINMNEHLMNYRHKDKMVQSTMKLSVSSCMFQI